MTTMNISLPEALKAFVDDQVASQGFASASEYVRELIRKERDRQRLRALILDGAESELGDVADAAFFDAMRTRIRSAGAA